MNKPDPKIAAEAEAIRAGRGPVQVEDNGGRDHRSLDEIVTTQKTEANTGGYVRRRPSPVTKRKF